MICEIAVLAYQLIRIGFEFQLLLGHLISRSDNVVIFILHVHHVFFVVRHWIHCPFVLKGLMTKAYLSLPWSRDLEVNKFLGGGLKGISAQDFSEYDSQVLNSWYMFLFE